MAKLTQVEISRALSADLVRHFGARAELVKAAKVYAFEPPAKEPGEERFYSEYFGLVIGVWFVLEGAL